MLNKETKNRIDNCRDILVGKLPLPSDQIEFITICLIYKFMNDMDEEVRELGGQLFFRDELNAFTWGKLIAKDIGTAERKQKFFDGCRKIVEAEHIEPFFKEIFKDRFLRFEFGIDEKTFDWLATEMSGFQYDHSEELGNAFEYLLETMGAQGKNGQFRTPRHIIEFMVEVVNPQWHDTILDPACGTSGFLISAFKHILRLHTKGLEQYSPILENYELPETGVNWGDLLKKDSPKMQKVYKNIVGYDITPLMTLLSKANMYLHDFKNPQIHTYDTISGTGRWNEKYTCILANPPFMTPKGGISPHSQYRIQASKAEILFADYIIEHLSPEGKAAFIVPEGIIFQNSGDYVELRKWLINDMGLWAVVSLPAKIFAPYSDVKTSILFLDRKFARQTNEIVLLKIDNDGYALNTNRNPIAQNDLPGALLYLRQHTREALNTNGKSYPIPKNILHLPRIEFAKLDAYKSKTVALHTITRAWNKRENDAKKIEERYEDGKLTETQRKEKLEEINRSFVAFAGFDGMPHTDDTLQQKFERIVKPLAEASGRLESDFEHYAYYEDKNKEVRFSLSNEVQKAIDDAREFIPFLVILL